MALPGSSSDKLANTLRLNGTKQLPLSVSNTTAPSAVFGQHTRVVRVWCDVECFVTAGKNPTATTNHVPVSAKSVEYFHVEPGDKLAVILASGTGTFYILEG